MITVTKTYNELLTLDDNDFNLYATPANTGSLGGHYWSSRPNFQDDVCVASPSDFLQAAGYDSFCRDSDYLEACGNEEYSLEVASHLDEVEVYA